MKTIVPISVPLRARTGRCRCARTIFVPLHVVVVVLSLVLASRCTSTVAAFAMVNVRTRTGRSSVTVTPSFIGSLPGRDRGEVLPRLPVVNSNNHFRAVTIRQGSASNDNERIDSETASSYNTSLFYGSLWATFLMFGLFGSPGQMGDPMDMQIIQSYIDNPSAPEGINALFLLIFNGLGVMPLIIAQLACPQGNKVGGLPAAPFLAASVAMGFGAAGLYLAFRSPPVSQKTQAEASWFTRTILENKLTSIASLLVLGASVTSALGTLPVPQDSATLSLVLGDYASLASHSKLVSVSTLDFIILTIVASTLIPRDLQLRMDDATSAGALGRKIALGTLFFPILGAALYCLWRPKLPSE